MSSDEDTELRDLIVQTLENNGVIGKIKAELRASVFLALEEEGSFRDKIPIVNKKLAAFITSPEGKKTISLVREFLEFFNLNFTLAVFDPEVSCSFPNLSREELRSQCHLDRVSPNFPLITELLNEKKSKDSSCSKLEHSNPVFTESAPILPKKTPSADIDIKSDSLSSNSSSKTISEGLINNSDLKLDENAGYDPFFDEPLPPNHSSIGIFNTLNENVPSKKTETNEEMLFKDQIGNKDSNDQNSFRRYLKNKTVEDQLKTKDKEDEHIQSNTLDKKEPSLFSIKADSITSLKDFPPLSTRSSIDSDWLLNKSQKKKLPTLKVDSQRKGIAKLEDMPASPPSESSSAEEPSKQKSEVSDSNEISEQSIEEDIDGEISGIDELLSSISVGENSTSDHTVSNKIRSAEQDYIEKCGSQK